MCTALLLCPILGSWNVNLGVIRTRTREREKERWLWGAYLLSDDVVKTAVKVDLSMNVNTP